MENKVTEKVTGKTEKDSKGEMGKRANGQKEKGEGEEEKRIAHN